MKAYIATPLLWGGFYWDFDHVKPYHPIGMYMVFESKKAQVQYYSSTKLKLQDIWFRKGEFIVHNKKGLFIRDNYSELWKYLNLFYKFLFKISFGIIGKTHGWMGLYKKV